ncbi:MAG TPA: MoxR family ATPase [Candidatus Gallacutalibacter pullistercoris]|nr:MoxR family ATPase [Candidatus Gallacutalibacter pullistercoris]
MAQDTIQALAQHLNESIGKVIKGKEDVIRKVTVCLLCGGHILLEDIPGTGKTTLVKSLARSVNASFTRVQFTPDLLPTDLTGANIYNQKTGEFTFKPGPVFTQILLADEINRATPRTQSSLLECMEEGQVTVDGQTHILEKPFFVVATQNPIEIQGTFPLPEAQLDRFFMRLAMGYPPAENEREMLAEFMLGSPLESISPVTDTDEILKAQQKIRQVHVSEAVQEYLLRIVAATRSHDRVRLGVSPRGSIAFLRASQAWAALEGRDYVLPDDLKAVCCDVLSHRLLCKGAHLSQNDAARAILEEILKLTPVPIEASV